MKCCRLPENVQGTSEQILPMGSSTYLVECNNNAVKNMSSLKYDVFLGGSCNPTTWRRDVAIPVLRRQGISYYNPQVAHWDKTLVELEYQAKQNASVHFFVFDNATRNIAAMGEAGFLAGSQRKMVVVIDNFSGTGQLINGEAISQAEHKELSHGLHMMQDLVERQAIPVFTQITHALTCTSKIICDNIWPNKLKVDKMNHVKYRHLRRGEKAMKFDDDFVNADSNTITWEEACVVFKVVTNRELKMEELNAVSDLKNSVITEEVNDTKLNLQDIHLTCEEFCCIVSKLENRSLDIRKISYLLSHSALSPIQKYVDWALPRRSLHSVNATISPDIYLGGSEDVCTKWRKDTAIPMIEAHGLTFGSPSFNSFASIGGRLSAKEAAYIEQSRVILFVISDTARDLSAMILASYYIGLKFNVVLCVQMLRPGTIIDNEQLTNLALKDYNRGRTYLSEQAAKEEGTTRVFQNIKDAVKCVIEKCESHR